MQQNSPAFPYTDKLTDRTPKSILGKRRIQQNESTAASNAVQKVREVGTSNRLRQVASRFALQSRRSKRCGFWSTRQNAKQVPTSRTFCTASSSCGKRCATVCRQVAPETHFLSMYLLLIPAQARCKGASGGDATNSPALARCINLRGRAMLAPTCTCKAAYRAAASPIRRSQQKSLSMRSFAIDGGLR